MSEYWNILMGKRRSLRGVLFVMLIIGLQILLTSKPALAHVALIRAEPADGEALGAAPGEVQLWFSEAVVTQFSSVQLVDEQNQPVLGTNLRGDSAEPTVLYITLPALKPGAYTLLWKAIAGSDGHFSQGFTTFSIGKNARAPHSPSAAPATSFSVLPSLVEGGLRWANFLFLASLVGALAIAQFGLRPVQRQATEGATVAQAALRRRLLRWATICAFGAWLIGLGLLGWQVAITQASVSANASWPSQAWSVLTQTHWGALWLVRQALLLLVGGGLWWVSGRQQLNAGWVFLVIAGRAIDGLIVQALASHALSSSSNWLLALGNATVHLLAASLWMGGLIALAVIVLPSVKRGAQAAPAWQALDWRAFSWLAVLSVGLLVASGLFSMGEQVASLDGLLTTVYGQLLLGKLGLVLLAAFCGLINTMLVHPQLAAPLARRLGRPTGWTPLALAGLPRLIGLEVALGILVFALTGLLTATPPPRGVEFTLAPEDISHSLGQRVGELFITLDVTPNRPGRNLLSIRNVFNQAATTTDITQVLLRFTAPNSDSEPIAAVAETVGLGLYQLTGNYLKEAGAWQIEVVTSRPGQEDRVARFDWVVAPPGVLRPVVWSKHPLTNLLTGLAGCWLLLLGLGLVGWRWWTARRTPHFAVQRDKPVLGTEAAAQTSVYHSSRSG